MPDARFRGSILFVKSALRGLCHGQRGKAIRELQAKVDSAVKKAGAGQEDKFKFVPHVTLGKLYGTDMNELFTYIQANNLFHTKPFQADSFTLYQSIARENGEGKYYKEIEEYPLMLV